METVRPEVTGKAAGVAQATTPDRRARGPPEVTDEPSSASATKHEPRSGGPPDAYSIREFCRRNNMSEATYYRLQREGKAPDRMRLGPKKILISDAAAERWRREREAEARALAAE